MDFLDLLSDNKMENRVAQVIPQQLTKFRPPDYDLQKTLDEVDNVQKIQPKHNLPEIQVSNNDRDCIRRLDSEESFDFLDDVNEVYKGDFGADQCDIPWRISRTSMIISQTAWIWGPEFILGPEAENVNGEVLHNLYQVIRRTRKIQFTGAKKRELLSPIPQNNEVKGLRGMVILLKEITEASETQFTLQENLFQYQQILMIVVEHELRSDDNWCGLIPGWVNVILGQFVAHRGLSKSVADVCSWSIYSTTLYKRTLDFTILLSLIQRLRKGFDELLNEEHFNIFWAATDSFTEVALSLISNLRSNSKLSTNSQQISALLECLKELSLKFPTRTGLSDLGFRIIGAVLKGTIDWYSQVAGEQNEEEETCNKKQLKNAIRICQELMTDLKTVLSVYEPIFQRVWEISAFSLVYLYYDGLLAESIKPIVNRIRRTLKLIKPNKEHIMAVAFKEASEEDKNKECSSSSETDVNDESGNYMEMMLLKIYLCLQQFYRLSNSLPRNEKKDVKLAMFYTWFEIAVDRWLDIALNKTLVFIGKAVSLDNLQTVDDIVKYSNSAVDTVTFLYQMKIYWEILDWPDVKGSAAYVNKIVEDLKESSLFYAEVMQLKLERIYSGLQSDFFISSNTCSVINSILHVRQFIKSLAKDMGYFKLNENAGGDNNLESSNNPTNDPLKDSFDRDINKKLDEIFIAIAQQFETKITRLIISAMETDLSVRETDELKDYICSQLLALNSNLPRDVILHVLKIIYHYILQSFFNVVEEEIKKKTRDPAYFRLWMEILSRPILGNCFQNLDAGQDEAIEDEILIKIRCLLKLHGMDTADLIHLYRLERMKQMEGIKNVGLSSLTVRVIFIGNTLTIDILNARNLTRMNTSGLDNRKMTKKEEKNINKSINSYVKVQLLPSHHFPDGVIKRSKVHKNNLFPLFEESFKYTVPKSLQTNKECCVLFTVKDKKFLGSNEFLGETYLTFQEITRDDTVVDMNELCQIVLPLAKLPQIDSQLAYEYLNVLEGRIWDKMARDFVKKEKNLLNKTKELS